MKASTLIKGGLAAASIGLGVLCVPAGAAVLAYIGVAAATTTGGAVGLGILGAIGGGIAGSIAGSIVSLPGKIFFGKKMLKAIKKVVPELFNPLSTTGRTNFSSKILKPGFAAATEGTAKKTASPAKTPAANVPKQV